MKINNIFWLLNKSLSTTTVYEYFWNNQMNEWEGAVASFNQI